MQHISSTFSNLRLPRIFYHEFLDLRKIQINYGSGCGIKKWKAGLSFNNGGGSTSAMSTSGIDFDISSTENGILHNARSPPLALTPTQVDKLYSATHAE